MRAGIGIILASLTLSCGTPPDTTVAERANTAAHAAKLEAAQDEVDGLRSKVERLEGEVDRLTSENEALQLRLATAERGAADLAELKRAREEAERYREGLQRAVETLNRQARLAAAAAVPPKTAPAPRSAVYVRQPQALVSNLDVVAEGTVHNAGSEVAVGFLELTLWIDDRQDASTTLNLEIAPRTVADYDWTFRNAVAGSQRARVEAVWGDFRP